MGFFSWCCSSCSKEILAPYPYSHWSDCVALFENGGIVKGIYDGYGRIETKEGAVISLNSIGEPEIFHKKCWNLIGCPTKFKKESKNAPDQGYFIDPLEYQIEDLFSSN